MQDCIGARLCLNLDACEVSVQDCIECMPPVFEYLSNMPHGYVVHTMCNDGACHVNTRLQCTIISCCVHACTVIADVCGILRLLGMTTKTIVTKVDVC